jgi:hypothetical protein
MADVQLSDAIIPEVFSDYEAVNSPEKTAFAASGVAVTNAALVAKANQGGYTIEVPFWNDLDASAEPNYSDDSATLAVPDKVDAGSQLARMAYVNKGWAAKDLVSELAGSDPMRHIRNRVDTYWARIWQKRIIAMVNGIKALSEAGTSDMVIDISIEDGNNATDANKISRTAITNAIFTSGDAFESGGAIGMHSTVYARLVELDDIAFIQPSEGTVLIPTYMERRVIIDDGMPSVAGGTSGVKFTTVLYGAGAIGYGIGSPLVPVEVDRTAASGAGGGLETLWSRNTWLIHPFGYKFLSTTVADESPTLAELALATNWERVVDRKLVPMAFLVTNG